MIHSILITGGNLQERQQKAIQLAEHFLGKTIKNNPDFLLIEEKETIKISQIRELQNKLALKPYQSPVKVALISEAEKLTLPAQQSFLKTLEEPPAHSLIILTTQTKEMLLPTIVSRCQVISLPTASVIADQSIFNLQFSILNSILDASPGQRLLIAEKYTQNREQAIDFCQKQLIAFREILRQKTLSDQKKQDKNYFPSLKINLILKILHQSQQSLRFLKANIQPRLVIENLLLSYPF